MAFKNSPDLAARWQTPDETESTNDGKKPKVLVTDDDVNFGKTIKGILEDWGYEVVVVRYKDEAIARLGEIEPDVVITDLMSPKLNGFEFIPLVKELHPSIPVIVLSGNLNARNDINAEKAQRALQLGAFDCIPKPCDVSDIRAVIERALKTS